MAIPIASLEDAFQVMLAFLYDADADKNELGDVEEPTHGEILALTAVVKFLHDAGAGEQFREPLLSLLDKVETAFYRRHFGKNLRRVQKEIDLAGAAAQVNYFHRKLRSISRDIPITKLVELVAENQQLDAKALKEFRADLGRKGKKGSRRASPRALKFYDDIFEHLCEEHGPLPKNGD